MTACPAAFGHVGPTVHGPKSPEPELRSEDPRTPLPGTSAYDNPIDIPNGSPLGASYGAVNGSAGFMVFPSLAAGIYAANASSGNYIQQNANLTITGLINIWAPPSVNPNAVANTLSGLGISASTANATKLSVLTASQLEQFVAAFAWQEGFKPSGC
jgi:hypothetical protein